MTFVDSLDTVALSFQNLWVGVAAFIPKLVIALLIFIIGWIVAFTLGKAVAQLLRMLKVDHVFKNLGFEEPVSRAGFKLDIGAFIGGLVKWFFILVALIAAVDILGLEALNDFLKSVVFYIPDVIVAALILVVAAVVAEALRKVVVGSAKAAHIPSPELMGGITKWAIWVFAFLAALFQLGIAGPFVQTLFTGFVGALAIALGLSFGLGGKEVAGRFLSKLGSDISNDRR
ncbi:MAG: hypothetical protein HY445_01105 [Candidatus Niyogibacteria bacterium]|nr:hypothetical protein [Candidatus Niyogibacteria bacterium]